MFAADVTTIIAVIEGEDRENAVISHSMNHIWLLSDKDTHFRFYWKSTIATLRDMK